MAPPREIVDWVKLAYPKPEIDLEWLDACCTWIRDEYNLNPAVQTEDFITHVETQLLESDLRDSMMNGTGLPTNARTFEKHRISGTPILVEVTAITEIGHSAFNLQNVRQTRIEREDLAGLAEQEGVENDEGAIPNYPRTMLKLEICDGTVTLPAIEYRPLPQLQLAETCLGYKIILKNVLIRKGIIFLEPGGIELKGHRTEDRDNLRDEDFVRSLCRRLGKPEPPRERQEGEDPPDPPPAPPVPPAPLNYRPPAVARPPSVAPDQRRQEPVLMDFDEDETTLVEKPAAPTPSTLPSTASTIVQSRFFSDAQAPLAGPSSNRQGQGSTQTSTQQLRRVMSPVRGEPIVLEDSSMESVDEYFFQPPPPPRSDSSGTVRRATNTPIPAPIVLEDEFEFDDDLDPAFLEEIDKVEKAALNQSASQAAASSSKLATPLVINPTSKSAPPRAGSSRPRPPNKRPMPTQSQPQRRAVTVNPEIITIEDDDDDDKENVAIHSRRRVRRRISVDPDDVVIDLSD